MPKQRIQVESGVPTATLRPTASPVDTFVPTDAGRELAGLAKGLASISPEVEKLAGTIADRYIAKEETSGAELANKLAAEKKSLKDAIKKGLLPRTASKYFIAGFHEQAGRVAADTWESDLITALNTDERMKSTASMEDFDQFVAEHQAQWLKEHAGEGATNQFFNTGFSFRAQAYLANLRRNFASQIRNRIENQSDELTYQEVFKHLGDNLGRVSDDTIAADITQLGRDLVLNQHRDGEQVNRTVVRALVNYALIHPEQGNKVLGLLDKIQAGSGPLSGTSYGSEALKIAKEQILDLNWQRRQRDRAIAEQEREDRSREVYSEALDVLSRDPHADLTPFIARLKDIPGAAGELRRIAADVDGLSNRTDQDIYRELFAGIWTPNGGVTARAVIGDLRRGNLTVSDASFLINQIQERDARAKAEATGGSRIENDFDFRQELGNIGNQFGRTAMGTFTGDNGTRAAYAEALFRRRWYEVHREGGPASKWAPEQKVEWLNNTARWAVDQASQGRSLQSITDKARAKVPSFPSESTAVSNSPASQAQKPSVQPDSAVLDISDFWQFRNGNITPALAGAFAKTGLPPEQRAAWVAEQWNLFKKQNTKP